MSSYESQDRGDDADYASYFAGMNRSMQQKVALTTAHFPPTGTVADMGSGSGQATFDLASLYSGLSLVGVDINPRAVAIATETHRRSNLRFMTGDIADPLFPDGSLDGILDSSVLHHVTSFNGFSLVPVERLLDNQTAALKLGGVLVIRDFVIPRGPETVDLDLLTSDGAASGDVANLSSASLFERFAATWKSSLGTIGHAVMPGSPDGTKRFRVKHRVAAEFVLRKDYRDHWDEELLEEYLYYSQRDFERAFDARGLRVVTSVELHNPWIVDHRFTGQIALFGTDGVPLPTPPTNYLIVGEKVAPSAGVRIVEESVRALDAPRFLTLSLHRHRETGHLYELAERPNRTVDVLPFFFSDGRAFVVCKHGFPRPIVNAASDAPDLIAQAGAGYVTEPIAAITLPGEASDRAALRILSERAGGAVVLSAGAARHYYTSPGGINERVDAFLVEIAPWAEEHAVQNYTPFADAGSVRFLDATQVLRACHVGGMFDARLELNISRLCLEKGLSRGPWIGAELDLHDHEAAPERRPFPEARACFERDTRGDLRPRFLEVCEGEFVERNAGGQVLTRARFEYVRPRVLSHNTITMLPVMRVGSTLWVGLESRDLPAIQAFEGTSTFLTLPALRLPRSVATLDEATRFALDSLAREHRLRVRRAIPLGGRYHPSLGITPEVVYPFVVDVARDEGSSLCFRPLDEALSLPLVDAHLLTALFRLSHAAATEEGVPRASC